MFAVLPEQIVREVIALAVEHRVGLLFGRVLDGDVYQITEVQLTTEPKVGQEVGFWFRNEDWSNEPDNFEALTGAFSTELFALVFDREDPQIGFYSNVEGKAVSVEFEVTRLKTDLYSRLQGIFETDVLANKVVAVIGLGTGGAFVALELAKCGVGHFRLVDFDRLKVHNVARHVCGLRDLGRLKTKAVKEVLLDKNPAVQVETFEFDVLKDEALLQQVIRGCDLVVAATDSERSKLAINRLCWQERIPAVYGAAYERALGGDIIRVIPNQTPCYHCILSQLLDFFEFPKQDGPIDYTSITDISDFQPEPGLGLDVGFIALIHAKMALLTLLRGTESKLVDFKCNLLIWGNRAEWIFEEPLECLFVEIEAKEDCPVCHRDNYLRKLGITPEEAQ
ncbi:MAG: ThiF family adenylyltransferase, partial [Chloroflexi bacterium]|nr:ThiF family adenylyltransferase [Chloroflexota bacterium]